MSDKDLFVTSGSSEGERRMRLIGLQKLNGWAKPLLTIIFSGLLAAGGAMLTMGQYQQKVDTNQSTVDKLDEKRVKPLEDRMALAETKNAVQDEKIDNVGKQVKDGFEEIKQLMRELKRDLKEEIKQKRDK